MEYNFQTELRRHTRRKKSNRLWLLFIFLFLASSIVGGILYYLDYLDHKPNLEKAIPYQGITNPTWTNGELWGKAPVKLDAGEILLPFSLIKAVIDPTIFWDESVQSVLITTKDKVMRFPNKQLQAYVNEAPFSLKIPVQKKDEDIYIPYNAIKNIYPIKLTLYPDHNVITIHTDGAVIQDGKIILSDPKEKELARPIRKGPSIKEPIYEEVPIDSSVQIFNEEAGWYHVLSSTGIAGYMEKTDVELGQSYVVNVKVSQKEFVPWNPLGEKINLTWEHVVSKNPDTAKIPEMNGLNVVSPTWFEIEDEQGNIANKADSKYTKWAHKHGYQIWALISNGFKPDRTHTILSSFETRQKIIKQMIEFAQMYDLDGYNLDFENVYLKDKELLVQFVRELTPYLHEQKLVVSMDVTFKSKSETWSMFYDREALSEVIDYMMVMGYDEHSAGSSTSGSVASMPWVEKGLQAILEEVPADKLLLGIPYYTRLWIETKDSSGKLVIKQKAYSMPSAQKWIEEHKLTPAFDEETGQYYVEYFDSKESVTYKMWLENESSIKQRAELVKKYDLAGIASWRRGFESADIWQVIVDTFTKLP